MTTDIYITREEVEAKLPALLLARTVKNASTKEDNELSAAVRKWMADEGEEELFDGEHGIRAYIKEVGAAPTWDIRTAPPDLILWLAQNGYLTVQTKKVDEDLKSAPTTQLMELNAKVKNVPKYRFPGVTTQLRVEKKD
jgi:hypothetical protein